MSHALIRQSMGETVEGDEDDESEIVMKFDWQEYLPEEARIKESFSQVCNTGNYRGALTRTGQRTGQKPFFAKMDRPG